MDTPNSKGPWCVVWSSWSNKDLSRLWKGRKGPRGSPAIYTDFAAAQERADMYSDGKVITMAEAILEFGDWR